MELDEEKFIQRILDDREFAFEHVLTIEDKEQNEIPFKLWDSQKRALKWINYAKKAQGRWKVFMPKLRQGGLSLLGIGDSVLDCRMQHNRKVLFLIKNDEDCEPFFDELKAMDKRLPEEVEGEKERNQSKAIKYVDTGSSIRILGAGQSEQSTQKKGRSAKSHMLWITEAEYIEHLGALLRGAKNSVTPNGVMVLESTMNGSTSNFAENIIEIISKGEEVENNVWIYEQNIVIFLPFYENPGYRLKAPDDFAPINEKEKKILDAGASPDAVYWRRIEIKNTQADNKTGLSPEHAVDYEFPAFLDDGLKASGRDFFARDVMDTLGALARLDRDKRPPLRVGIMSEGGRAKWIKPHGLNDIEIFELPEKGWSNRYIVFADCAEGLPTSDFDVIWVFDRANGCDVARHRVRCGAKIQVEIMLLLAVMYDNAWISWDRTGIGSDRLPYLLMPENRYNYLISTRDVDNVFTEPDYLGVKWNHDNKTQACQRLKYLVEDRVWKIKSKQFYDEAGKFIYPDDSKGLKKSPEAASGAFDDEIMTAVGVAYVDNLLTLSGKVPHQKVKASKFKAENILQRKLKQAKQPNMGAYSGGGME